MQAMMLPVAPRYSAPPPLLCCIDAPFPSKRYQLLPLHREGLDFATRRKSGSSVQCSRASRQRSRSWPSPNDPVPHENDPRNPFKPLPAPPPNPVTAEESTKSSSSSPPLYLGLDKVETWNPQSPDFGIGSSKDFKGFPEKVKKWQDDRRKDGHIQRVTPLPSFGRVQSVTPLPSFGDFTGTPSSSPGAAGYDLTDKLPSSSSTTGYGAGAGHAASKMGVASLGNSSSVTSDNSRAVTGYGASTVGEFASQRAGPGGSTEEDPFTGRGASTAFEASKVPSGASKVPSGASKVSSGATGGYGASTIRTVETGGYGASTVTGYGASTVDGYRHGVSAVGTPTDESPPRGYGAASSAADSTFSSAKRVGSDAASFPASSSPSRGHGASASPIRGYGVGNGAIFPSGGYGASTFGAGATGGYGASNLAGGAYSSSSSSVVSGHEMRNAGGNALADASTLRTSSNADAAPGKGYAEGVIVGDSASTAAGNRATTSGFGNPSVGGYRATGHGAEAGVYEARRGASDSGMPSRGFRASASEDVAGRLTDGNGASTSYGDNANTTASSAAGYGAASPAADYGAASSAAGYGATGGYGAATPAVDDPSVLRTSSYGAVESPSGGYTASPERGYGASATGGYGAATIGDRTTIATGGYGASTVRGGYGAATIGDATTTSTGGYGSSTVHGAATGGLTPGDNSASDRTGYGANNVPTLRGYGASANRGGSGSTGYGAATVDSVLAANGSPTPSSSGPFGTENSTSSSAMDFLFPRGGPPSSPTHPPAYSAYSASLVPSSRDPSRLSSPSSSAYAMPLPSPVSSNAQGRSLPASSSSASPEQGPWQQGVGLRPGASSGSAGHSTQSSWQQGAGHSTQSSWQQGAGSPHMTAPPSSYRTASDSLQKGFSSGWSARSGRGFQPYQSGYVAPPRGRPEEWNNQPEGSWNRDFDFATNTYRRGSSSSSSSSTWNSGSQGASQQQARPFLTSWKRSSPPTQPQQGVTGASVSSWQLRSEEGGAAGGSSSSSRFSASPAAQYRSPEDSFEGSYETRPASSDAVAEYTGSMRGSQMLRALPSHFTASSAVVDVTSTATSMGSDDETRLNSYIGD